MPHVDWTHMLRKGWNRPHGQRPLKTHLNKKTGDRTYEGEQKQLTATLNLISNDGNLSFTSSTGYKQLYDVQQEVDNANGFVTLVTVDPSSIGQNQLKDPKFICIYNESDQVAEICITYQGITAGTTDATGGADGVVSKVLRPNEYVVYPNAMAVNYITADNSAMNGTDLSLDDVVPNSSEIIDSGANVDNATASGVVGSDTSTTLYLEAWTDASNNDAQKFKVGDLIQISTEVMEVTAIGDKSNLANNYLTVIRGVNGSVAIDSIADGNPVNFPFFNALTSYTSATGGYDVCQTDESGNARFTNFFGYGRNALASLDGFCRGTIGFRFYEVGYQEFGMSGITNNTETGLTASTNYYIKIGIDGATADELTITTDSSVSTFGGTNGFLQKFQTAINDLYADHGKNNKGKKATVSLINGDIRVTSSSHLSTSAIALTAGTSGADTTTELLAQQIGVIPILDKIEHPVASKLPDTTIVKDGISVPNTDVYLLDDGYGNLVSGSKISGSGTIDYDTGAVTLRNCPPLAEFTISGIGLSGLGCGSNSALNMITKVQARSTSNKRNAKVRLLAFDL